VKRNAFTLVELMASLAISALLLVSVMGLTARLSLAARQIRENYPIHHWKEVLRNRLESDFQNARSIVVRDQEIVIEGMSTRSAIGTDDGFALHVPARITYTIQSNDDSYLLTRGEQRLGVAPPDARSLEFLCSGIVRFRTDQPLATDVAPGILGLEMYELNIEQPIKLTLVRHGMIE